MANEEIKIHVDDIGVIFEITLQDADGIFAIDGATTLEITFLKPDGITDLQTAILSTDGLDGKLRYVAVSGDLDQKGDWKLQAYIEKVGFIGHSSVGQFEVFPNL